MFRVSTQAFDYNNNRFHGCRISPLILTFTGKAIVVTYVIVFVFSLNHFYFSLHVFAFGVDAHEIKMKEGKPSKS